MTRSASELRYDYFLVWGHGIGHLDQMLSMIRNHPALKVVLIKNHLPQTVEELVTVVYSFDYAPIEHLKGKTEYLKRTPCECYFIVVENHDPDEDYFGEGAFRHIESRTVKALKERIRDLCNPRFGGRRSEEHVIHASDNQMQTDYILKYLGLTGIDCFGNGNVALNAPYHMGEIAQYSLKYVSLAALWCRIVTGPRHCYSAELTPVQHTPHYRALCGDCDPYRQYLATYLGTALCDDHSLYNLLRLRESFSYLQAPFDCDYVIVQETEEGKFEVLDGVHRVAVLKYQGAAAIHVVVL